jgi:hypothetical protein
MFRRLPLDEFDPRGGACRDATFETSAHADPDSRLRAIVAG